MGKKELADIEEGSRLYMEEARGQAAKPQRPAQAAAAKPVAPRPEVKAPDYKHIGKPTSRIDGREIVTARAQ